MSLTIGRVELDCPYDITHDGDRLSFLVDVDGYLTGASVDVAKVFRQQLLGLVDNADEPVVPITWSDDSDWDGFYRIDSVQIVPTEVYLTDGYVRHFTVAVSASRVGSGFAAPVHELWAIFAKNNDIDLAVSASVEAQSAVYLPTSFAPQNAQTDSSDRTAADGSDIAEVVVNALNTGASIDAVVWNHLAAPADFLDAATTVEQQTGGSWYPVVGRQISESATVRASNGLVRVSVALDGEITVESWDGSVWQPKLYEITGVSVARTISTINAVSVRRNGYDECVVMWRGVDNGDRGVWVSARLLRGEVMAEIAVASPTPGSWKITRSTTEAGTTIDDDNSEPFAVRATSNDANGDRYVIASREDAAVGTADTTNGGWTAGVTGAASGLGLGTPAVVFGVGLEIDGSSATSPNDAETMAERFLVNRSVVRSVL